MVLGIVRQGTQHQEAAMTQQMSDPRRSTLDRGTSMRLAATEYGRVTEMFDVLTLPQWAMPTNCPPWDVRQMASHMLGMAEMAASPLEQRRQMRAAGRRGGDFVESLCAGQVEKHAQHTPAEIRALWKRTASRAARGRRMIPGFMRRRAMPQAQMINGTEEAWTIGYLTETILTRDPWMHRLDIAAATGVKPTLTADHDGAIIDDLVREWAARHGQPVRLHLDGPAGGTWEFGSGGPLLELDTIDFCRQTSGRSTPAGLTETQVPY
jgi:uncharacterized protein (TIGR03083 family)